MSAFSEVGLKAVAVDAGWRLLFALAASAALHLWLVFGVAVRPLSSPQHSTAIAARIQAQPAEPAEQLARTPAVRSRVEQGPAVRQAEPARALPGAAPVARAAAPVLSADSALPEVEMPLLSDSIWYTAQQLDVFPRTIAPVRPAFPDRAARERVGGTVTLLLLVDERGRVHQASVVAAMPQGVFDQAALSAFQAAQFMPAQKDGRSVRSRILVRVTFDPRELSPADQEPADSPSPQRHEGAQQADAQHSPNGVEPAQASQAR